MRAALLLLILIGCCCASSAAVAEDDPPNHVGAAGNLVTKAAPRTVVEVPDFRIDRELRGALVEGLMVTFRRQAAGQTISDTRNSRLAALYVEPDAAASAFLHPGPFTATFAGFLKLKLKTECSLSLAGRGKATLYVNETAVLTAAGDDFSAAGEVTVALGKYNPLRLEYTSPPDGAARVQLYWRSDEFALEQVPPSSLYCNGSNVNLVAGQQLRVGRGLLANHLCLKCHTMADAESLAGHGMPELGKQAPSLVGAGQRFQMPWLVQWILNPHAVRNKVTMPALFPDPDSEAARREAADIAAFVASLTAVAADAPPKTAAGAGGDGNGNAGGDGNAVGDGQGDGKAGEQLYEDLGCIACHRISGPAEEDTLNRVSLRHVALKFRPGALAVFLQNPRGHYAWSRMPDFRLTAAEAASLEAYIRANADGTLDEFQTSPKVSAELGRIGFQARGCANCHDTGEKKLDIKRSGPAIDRTAPQKGCLAENTGDGGNAPFFGFSDTERAALGAFLTTDCSSLQNNVPAEASRRQIQRLHCVACHRMDSFDSDLALAVEEYGSVKPQDDLMPILTFAGERLYSDWTEKLFAGQLASRSRPWLATRMPSFPTRARTLAQGLAAQHGFAPARQPPFEVDAKKAEIGYRLTLKDGGFDCVQCHGIGGQPPTATFDARGVNFAVSAERLRREYYDRWMLNPQRFDPTTKMPRFSADGIKTSLEHVHDGDAAKQFDALWHYVRSLHAKPNTAVSEK
jgi:mono/diheme cytochrome c family protein